MANLTPEAFIDKEFRKVSASPQEYIKFVSTESFWHRFQDAEWTAHPYRVTNDGFELHWGEDTVFRCVFSGTSGSSVEFVECNPSGPFTWRLETLRHGYSDRGSTSA